MRGLFQKFTAPKSPAMRKHFTRSRLFFIFLIFVYSDVQAQFSGVKWDMKVFVHEGSRPTNTPKEVLRKIITNEKNEVFVVGRFERQTQGGETWGSIVRKINTEGKIIWETSVGKYFFNADRKALFTKALPTIDGGVIVLTVSSDYRVGIPGLDGTDELRADIDLYKIAANGTVEWHKYFGGSRFDFPNSFLLDRSGNIVIVGQTWSSDHDFTGKHKYIDTASYAYKTWGSLGDTSIQVPDSISIPAKAKYAISNDAFVMKVSPSGQLLAVKCFGGTSTDEFTDIIEHPDYGYVIIGDSQSKDGELPQQGTNGGLWLMRLDTALNIVNNRIVDSATVIGKSHFFVKDKKMYLSDFSSLRQLGLDGGIISERSTNGLFVDQNSYFDQSGYVFVPTGKSINVYDSSFHFIDSLKFAGWQYGYTDVTVEGTNRNNLLLNAKTPKFEYDIWWGIEEFTRHYYSFGILNFAQQYNKVKGNIFSDDNKNNVRDNGELLISGIKIEAQKVNYSLTALSGTFDGYQLPLDSGNYTIKVSSNLPYHTIAPVSVSLQFPAFDKTETINFALQPNVNKKDLSINLLPLNIARPGFLVQYQLICTNQGTETISNVQVKLLRNPRVSFVSSLPVVSTTVGDTLIWNIASLKPFDTSYIQLNMRIVAPPIVNNTDTLVFKTVVFPLTSDETPEDNRFVLVQEVQGSYDPNDKTETHGGVITPEQLAGNEFLTYLIRFQNTGTDTAFNVMIRDTLQNKLDWSSFEMISSSHPYQLYMIRPDVLEWSFPNILLVDSNRNEPASHGFIAYRIKPKPTLAVGDTVLNRAHIFFDYNLPVTTNDEQTVLRNTLVTSVIDLNNSVGSLLIYPNPSKSMVTVIRKGRINGVTDLRITDINGRLVYAANFGKIVSNEFNRQVDIAGFPAGFYVLHLWCGTELYSSKLIIK